jgi:hypothetical protein
VAFTLCDATFRSNIASKYQNLVYPSSLCADDQDVDGGGDCVHTLLLPTQHWLGRAKFVYIFIFYIYFQSPPYMYVFGRPRGTKLGLPKENITRVEGDPKSPVSWKLAATRNLRQ